MKKLVVSVLAVFYFGLASGTTLHFHYCMGELINWGISHENTEKCSNCGMKKGNSGDCCQDQHQKLEVEDSQKAFSTVYNFNISSNPVLLFPLHYEFGTIVPSVEAPQPVSASPPRTQVTPVFIRNCSFRI